MSVPILQADTLELVSEDYSTDRRAEVAQVIMDNWGPDTDVRDIADIADCTPGLVETVLLNHFSPAPQAGEVDQATQEDRDAQTSVDYEEVARLMDEEGLSRQEAVEQARAQAQQEAQGGQQRQGPQPPEQEVGQQPQAQPQQPPQQEAAAQPPQGQQQAQQPQGGAAGADAVPTEFRPDMNPAEAYRVGFRDGFEAGQQMGGGPRSGIVSSTGGQEQEQGREQDQQGGTPEQ